MREEGGTRMGEFFQHKYAVAMSFALLAIVIFLVVTNESKTGEANLIQMCDSINQTVNELNDRIGSHRADTQGLIDFLEGAKLAREAAFERAGAKEDQDAARTYGEIITAVESNVKFDELKPLSCAEIVG